MNIAPGARVRCSFGGSTVEAVFITARGDRAVVKLPSGYNVGMEMADIELLSPPPPVRPRIPRLEQHASLPECAIISTGGTIASRVDYRTGAVTSQFSAEDILTAIPELAAIARFRTQQISSILSENMHAGIWQELARAVHDEIRRGAAGVIVTHGTDTMAYTASAISFMVRTPVPIVFVGSQRSADRPSSDNAMNAVCSAKAALSGLGEVAVVMHATTSDDLCAIHRATRVRKMHTSRRDAFRSIGIEPLGYVEYPTLGVRLGGEAVRRGTHPLELRDRIDARCALVAFAPGMDADVLEAFRGYHGIVLMGTGLGHVSSTWVPRIRELVRDGTFVVMTSQCLYGRVCDRVYDTGRDLLQAGVMEGEDMLPEVALVKLAWVLGQESEPERVREMMAENLRGEICRRSCHGL